jgi:hypothetical protein
MNIMPYIHWLADEYRNFLLLPVLAASPDGEPPKEAKYSIQHTGSHI